jgi:sigma-E factor negative regulatory protein RseB
MSEARVGAALGASLALGGALGALPALADDEARQWLADMNEAVASRTYQGEFLHLIDGRVERLKILHRFKDGHITERLVSLSGSGREVVRNDLEVQCYLPDQHKVLVESHTAHGSLLGMLPASDANLETYYRLELGPRVRSVIDRTVRILSVHPRDGYRFGYRLQIDERTHMPVQTDLCDAQGKVLEQVLFTSLKVGGTLADAAFRPTLPVDGYTWVRQAPGQVQAGNAAALPWRLKQLPPGFKFSSSGLELLPGSDVPVAHLVVSDGLAMVSVFIAGPSPPRRAVDGEGRVGAAFAYSRVLGDQLVTAVGEVPPATLQYIVAGVAPVSAKIAFGGAAPAPR